MQCTIVRLGNSRVRRAKNSSRHLTSTFLSSIDVFVRSLRFHADINSAKGPPRRAKTKDVDPPQAPVRDRSRPSVWYRYVRSAEPRRSACAFPYALNRLYIRRRNRAAQSSYLLRCHGPLLRKIAACASVRDVTVYYA